MQKPNPNYERPIEAPTYPDEYLDFWAGVYLVNPHLRARGVLFSTFLIAPIEILRACATPGPAIRACRARVTFPRDEAVILTVAEAAVRHAERMEGHGENGRLVEKMRSRVFPSRRRMLRPHSQLSYRRRVWRQKAV